MEVKAVRNNVVVTDLETGEKKTATGIVVLDDSNIEAGERGIRPRWAKVHAVGPENTDVKVGEWILLEHGRWTEGQTLRMGDEEMRIWLADPEGIMGVSESGKPEGL